MAGGPELLLLVLTWLALLAVPGLATASLAAAWRQCSCLGPLSWLNSCSSSSRCRGAFLSVVSPLLLLMLLAASWADLGEGPLLVLVVVQQVVLVGRHSLMMMMLLAGRTRLSSRLSFRA